MLLQALVGRRLVRLKACFRRILGGLELLKLLLCCQVGLARDAGLTQCRLELLLNGE